MSRHIGPRPSDQSKEDAAEQLPALTPEQLTEIVLDPKFLSRLFRSWQISRETHHEAGFAVGVDLNTGKVQWGKTVGASQTGIIDPWQSMNANLAHEISLGAHYEKRGIFPALSFHTHPRDIIAPSGREGDLNYLFTHRDLPVKLSNTYFVIEGYPIMGIGTVQTGANELLVLLIQEKTRDIGRGPKEAQMVDEQLYQLTQGRLDQMDSMSREELVAIFSRLPYIKTAILSFRLQGKKIIPNQSPQEITALLKDFAFQPKKISQSE